jgi:autotransporter strand-loop-strand O-heptosyltransferase
MRHVAFAQADADRRCELVGDIQALEAQRARLVEQAEQAYSEFQRIEQGLDRLRAELATLEGSGAQDAGADRATAEATQEGPLGIRFDFNYGARLMLPPSDHPWRVRLFDRDTQSLLFEARLKSGCVGSRKVYYINFGIEISQNGERVFVHDYCAAGRDVLIKFPGDGLGDSIAWFSYVPRFQERHGCKLTVAMGGKIVPLFRGAYPDIDFIPLEQLEYVEPEKYYASYNVGLFRDDDDCNHRPCDYRLVGLHRIAAYILGVDPAEEPPRVCIEDGGRPIPDRYCCIGVQATTQAKYWNRPGGWDEIVGFLKESGFRVICIDRERTYGEWNRIPDGAEDQTGDRPLQERARWLRHAEFFIGLSSGLSWLAWACGVPVVMISGFTHPVNEFATSYRVINWNACCCCWNDARHRFDDKDYLYCPRHRDTPRQFECTRLVTADQVKAMVRSIPSFGRPAPDDRLLLAPSAKRRGKNPGAAQSPMGQPHQGGVANDRRDRHRGWATLDSG